MSRLKMNPKKEAYWPLLKQGFSYCLQVGTVEYCKDGGFDGWYHVRRCMVCRKLFKCKAIQLGWYEEDLCPTHLKKLYGDTFKPHFGVDFGKLQKIVSEMTSYAGINYSEELIQHVEGIAALFLTLEGCQDYVSMAGAIFLYIRKFLNKSVTSMVMDYLSELFEFSAQSDSDTVDLVKSRDWIGLMKNLRDNWQAVRNNQLFDHFSKLLGVIVSLELCNVSDVSFSIKEYKVWEPDMKIIHGTAIDVFDAAFSTIVFFVESMSLCWEQKSLRPLIRGDDSATALDEEFSNVVSWWELIKNGNLERVAHITDNEFNSRLEALIDKIKILVGSLKAFDKKIMQDKFQKLLNIKNDFITLKISCGTRKAPFCLEFFGESSQGKSTLAEQMQHALFVSAGLPTDKKYQASNNASDRFMSAWSSDKLVLLLDDVANEKSDLVERPPTRIIIDVCNNQPYYANMADLDKKGKVYVEPELVIITTNVKDLDAHTYSNCPYSVQRRAHYVIVTKAKPEFQRIVDNKPQGVDPAKVAKYNELHPENVFDDIWDITIERAISPPQGKMQLRADYEVVVHNGKRLENLSFRQATQFMISQFNEHRFSQKCLLEGLKKRRDVHKCDYEGCMQIRGMCDLHDHIVRKQVLEETVFEQHFGEEIVKTTNNIVTKFKNKIVSDFFGLDKAIEGACVLGLVHASEMFYKQWDWMKVIPTPIVQHRWFLDFMHAADYPKLKRLYIRRTCSLWPSLFGLAYSARLLPKSLKYTSWIGLGYLGFCAQKNMVHVVKKHHEKVLLERNTISATWQKVRDKHVTQICKASCILGALYGLGRVYKVWKNSQPPQGSLEPKTEKDVIERDLETNVWTQVTIRELPVSIDAVNTTSDQLIGLVEKNLVYGTVVVAGKALRVNGLFLASNLVVIPNHYFEDTTLEVTFRKKNPETSGGKFATRLSLDHSVLLPDSDIRLCYCPTGGSFKDLTKYLPSSELPPLEFSMRWRGKDGELTCANGLGSIQDTNNTVAHFKGLVYSTLSINTFPGMCGATLVARRKPVLIGIHLGGKSDTPRGCAGLLPRKDVEEAIVKLRNIDAVVLSGTAEKFETQVLGKNIVTGCELHPKSALAFTPHNSQIEFYGTCHGMSTFKSQVKPTVISEAVTDVMDQPNIFGPPIVNPQYEGWQMCLEAVAIPALPYPPSLLIAAVQDYKSNLIPIFESELWKDARPLTYHENLCGIPGKKFIDSIPLDTSIGFPLCGPKRRYVDDLEPTQDKPNNRVFQKPIMDEIERCESCYKRSERAYTIAKACKKDEVLSKRKCRIFYGNPIALTFLVRKYYLPLVRVLQFNPLVSECAVGINCYGPEWQQLHDHVFHFGDDRLIGGDYAQYDQRIPSQLIFAALRILIDCAKACNYTDEDLRVMEAMTGDLVFALIAYNGDLIGLTEGTHISGNSLTAVINGICGSLNMRAYYYHGHPEFVGANNFQQHVKVMTYGDDNIGSVDRYVKNFTIRGFSEFLAEYGQLYTMPDKESELLDFLPSEEFEFLKRKSNYVRELGVHVGALSDKSCFKMLHCYLRDKKSPLTEEHACATNIDTALREWFGHGRETYELRRMQLKEVAKRTNITYLCTTLDKTFDECVDEWKIKYAKPLILDSAEADKMFDIISYQDFLDCGLDPDEYGFCD